MYQIPSNSGVTKADRPSPPSCPERPLTPASPSSEGIIQKWGRLCLSFFLSFLFWSFIKKKKVGDLFENRVGFKSQQPLLYTVGRGRHGASLGSLGIRGQLGGLAFSPSSKKPWGRCGSDLPPRLVAASHPLPDAVRSSGRGLEGNRGHPGCSPSLPLAAPRAPPPVNPGLRQGHLSPRVPPDPLCLWSRRVSFPNQPAVWSPGWLQPSNLVTRLPGVPSKAPQHASIQNPRTLLTAPTIRGAVQMAGTEDPPWQWERAW